MAQDTGKFRTQSLDQFYTKKEVAKKCVATILQLAPQTSNYQWIEPSAGKGTFLKALPATVNRLGIDLDPKSPFVKKGDFLLWEPSGQGPKIVFGNPPFGRQSSTAKAFIQHAASFASVIAFILPRSFVKPSMSNAFPLAFHCIHTESVEKDAFELNGSPYDVPCVFQIWEKRAEPRAAANKIQEEGFTYVKDNYHIAFRRVGGLAGKAYLSGDHSAQSHYFLKLEDRALPHRVRIIEKINKHIFPSNTVGPRSLSKTEANEVINVILNEIHEEETALAVE
uniref:Methyltransferase n=1 Tax=viral metagenome TaxID=1070528 RepID=A0A6C0BB47_9ZZZZ